MFKIRHSLSLRMKFILVRHAIDPSVGALLWDPSHRKVYNDKLHPSPQMTCDIFKFITNYVKYDYGISIYDSRHINFQHKAHNLEKCIEATYECDVLKDVRGREPEAELTWRAKRRIHGVPQRTLPHTAHQIS
jgi:hypothetical protein